MKTLFAVGNVRMLKRVAIVAALASALVACGGGGSSGGGGSTSSVALEDRVTSLFAQFDAGTLSEDDLITQLKALGF